LISCSRRQRIDLALARLLVEVDAVVVERIALLFGSSPDFSRPPRRRRGRALLGEAGRLAMPWLM